MKVEFLALIFFAMSAILAGMVFSHREPERVVEEVFQAPQCSLANPFSHGTHRSVYEINRQMLTLEYGLRFQKSSLDLADLVSLHSAIDDPRGTKSFRKVLVQYWWGYGLREATLTVKHITLNWRPAIRRDPRAKFTFGEALLRSLEGFAASYAPNGMSEEFTTQLAQKYGVREIK